VTTPVGELELPVLDLEGLDRMQALAAVTNVGTRHWLARTPMGYALTDYPDVVAVLRDRRFHSALALVPQIRAGAGAGPDRRAGRRPSILEMEGDEHARLRRLVAPAFTPLSADRLRPSMRRVIGGLAERFVEAGRCELVRDVCDPYPIPIICELLGAPPDDADRFSRWATDIFRVFNQDLDRDLPLIIAAAQELGSYVRSLIEERRRSPGEDLLSELIAVEQSGDRLSTSEMSMLAEAVLMAGTDTTRNQLACTVALFAEHPAQWELLAGRPELAPRAVEESMRYLGAVRGTVRFASEDIEYRGVLFPRGTIVSAHLAGANRSPAFFSQPECFDITAEREVGQLTFGSGIHHCLGAALARAELQEALVVLPQLMANLRLDGPVEWKPPTFGIWGPARLPLRFERRRQA
jgi:cytochrome P450